MEAIIYAFESVISNPNLLTERKIRIIKDCIAFGIDINRNESKILFEAIEQNDYDIIVFLIDNGVDVGARDNEAIIRACNFSSTYRKCTESREKIIKLLLESGGNVSSRDNSAIYNYAISGQYSLDTIKILIEYGADPFVHDNILFYEACRRNYLSEAEYLIGIGASIIGEERYFNLFLKYYLSVEIRKLLLDNGFDPNTIYDNISLIENAIDRLDIKTCRLLFEYGVDIMSRHDQVLYQIKNTYRFMQQYCKEDMPKYIELINLLVDNGLDHITDSF